MEFAADGEASRQHCTQCTSIVHQECIDKQVSSGIKTCGKCNSSLKVNSSKEYYCSCVNTKAFRVWFILYIFCAWVWTYLLIQGKSLMTPYFLSVFMGIFISLCSQFIALGMILDVPIEQINKLQYSYAALIITPIQVASIMVLHGVGYGISFLHIGILAG